MRKLPEPYAAKVMWGTRYPHHDTTSAWDAVVLLSQANIPEALTARMPGGDAVQLFGIVPAPTTVNV